MLVLTVIVVFSWELYLRSKGVTIAYDDGPALWSNSRAQVYEPSDEAVVFIGSSRNKYDLDIPTWEAKTGARAIQLAIEGSCPRPILDDLANDPDFKGKLIIDVTEILFFSGAPPNLEKPNSSIKYFRERTPAQQASLWINKPLESSFVFLEKDYFSLNAMLDELEIPSRPGVFMMPIFPWEFNRNTYDRQSCMTEAFVKDPRLTGQVKGVWHFFAELGKGAPPMPEAATDAIFSSVKGAVNKIKARGGEVIFVRTPSSGPYLAGEQMLFPKAKYWDRLLRETNCRGIYFQDYPVIAHFECPEFSHLSPPDAIIFTKALVGILQEENGWKFTKTSN